MQNEKLITNIVSKLLERGETLSFAESCTGGLLSSQVAALSGVSQVYNGAVVAYSNDIKENILDVPKELIQKFGAVSVEVALKMADGARAKLKSSWAVSVTGIAGPSGGSIQKPVGTVCFAVVGSPLATSSGTGGAVQIVDRQLFSGSRTEIQGLAAQFALNLLWRHLGPTSDV